LLVPEIINVEVGPFAEVPREDEPRREIINAGEEHAANQEQEIRP
jgi:hypothetical protein